MTTPISPPPIAGGATTDLPAYVSNGLIGLRVRDNPLTAGMTLLNGYAGEHASRQIEAAALAPYPLAGDIRVNGVWMSDAPQAVRIIDQAYDFATAELTSRLAFTVDGREAQVEVVTFASRDRPTLICQEIAIEADGACDVALRAEVDVSGIGGRALSYHRETPGEPQPSCDGTLLWESPGGLSTCGLAYATELVGAAVEPERPPLDGAGLTSEYAWRARRGRTYRLRQLVCLIPRQLHNQPHLEAARLVTFAADAGFEAIRKANRLIWRDIWKGRIRLVGADERWQAMTDAAFFYLMTSVHPSAPSSTSIFGLATWHDYHYYFGHVMWDIEAFCVPPLIFLQPHAAASILNYRVLKLASARGNALLMGRRGAQFPWESAPSSGEEEAPVPGSAAWREDHVSLDVALAFARYANVTGDMNFLRDKAWPVLSGVAEWIKSRAVKTGRGYEILASMGIAERKQPADNAVFTTMSARLALEAAISAGQRLGLPVDPDWPAVAAELVIPKRDNLLISHDGYRETEEKGATPDPLMGVFPLGFPMEAETEQATLNYYLAKAHDYLGSPMLSALYGVWAARAGDRRLAAEMLELGYGRFCAGRFTQTLEYREDVFPEQPRAGPFFANLGGFLMGLLQGFPRIEPNSGEPETWCKGPIVLPSGWQAIEIDRLWIRGQPWRLSARQGAETAQLTPV